MVQERGSTSLTLKEVHVFSQREGGKYRCHYAVNDQKLQNTKTSQVRFFNDNVPEDESQEQLAPSKTTTAMPSG